MFQAKSTHRVEVIPITLRPHPNADSLSVVDVFGGYTCVVRTADWRDGDLAAYIPPDSLVDTRRPEFGFLAGKERVKVRTLRGVVSMGLLVPAPPGAQVGDDVAGILGVTHYEPPLAISTTGRDAPPPPHRPPNYEIENLRRYPHVFEPGEPVRVTEKIHGTAARYCFVDGRMHCGSRNAWFVEDEKNVWWQGLRVSPGLERFCRAHPELTVYGEVYGAVQDLRYGMRKGQLRFAAFDFRVAGRWLNVDEMDTLATALPCVPVVEPAFPYDTGAVLALAEGRSLVPGADHVREGVVVRPLAERTHPDCGRLVLKVVGNTYLERA